MVEKKAVLFGITCLLLALLLNFAIVIQEGEIGISYVLGSLQNKTHLPGLHFVLIWPFVRISRVNIRPQTDQVFKVACGTSDGLTLIFETIDVGNTLPKERALSVIRDYGEDYDTYLIKDKIRHQMQVICAERTTNEIYVTHFEKIDDLLQEFLKDQNAKSGLMIDFVRLSKPLIPEKLKERYEAIATERLGVRVETERQQRMMKEAETKTLIEKQNIELGVLKTEGERNQMLRQADTKKLLYEHEITMQILKQESDRNQTIHQSQVKKLLADNEYIISNLQMKTMEQEYLIPGRIAVLISQTLANALANNSKFVLGTNNDLQTLLVSTLAMLNISLV